VPAVDKHEVENDNWISMCSLVMLLVSWKKPLTAILAKLHSVSHQTLVLNNVIIF